MKRLLSLLIAAMMALTLIPSAFAEEEPLFKTMGDALAEDVTAGPYGWFESDFVAIAKVGDAYIRVVADVDEETAQHVKDLYRADDFDAAMDELEALQKTLPVAYTEDITATLKDQAELDPFVGKTLADLKEAGFELTSYGWGEDVDFTFRSGLFEYNFVVNESPELFQERYESENWDDFTVKSARFEGVAGIALDLNYKADGTYAAPEEASEEDDENPFSTIMTIFGEALVAAENEGEIDWDVFVQELTERFPDHAEAIQTVYKLIQSAIAEKTAE